MTHITFMLYGAAAVLLLLALILVALNRWALVGLTLTERVKQCKHQPTPIAVAGQPGKECLKCGYYMRISSREFKELFGMSFSRMSRTIGRTAVD